MSRVTVATEVGFHTIKGAEHKRPCYHWQLTPGYAYQIDDDTRQHEIVEVRDVKKAEYSFTLRWIEGRSVAVFNGPDGHEYAQPISEDSRARDRPARAPRAPRRDAPGVAPEVAPEVRGENDPGRVTVPRVRDRQASKPLILRSRVPRREKP